MILVMKLAQECLNPALQGGGGPSVPQAEERGGLARHGDQKWEYIHLSLSLSLSLSPIHYMLCVGKNIIMLSIYPHICIQTSGPVLVKEYSATVGSPHRMCFSPTPLVRTSQGSRGSNTSTLDCSLVALDLGSDTGTTEVDDSAFCSPYVPVSMESSSPKEQFAVRTWGSVKCIIMVGKWERMSWVKD